MNSRFNDLPQDPKLAKQVLDTNSAIEKQKAEQGMLGRIWGSTASIPHNIAALLIVLLLISGILYTFLVVHNVGLEKSFQLIKDFWLIITPLITLSIGYLFGEKSKSKTE